ncbi:MAG: calcium/sodium antiporter [Planctomycetes bacterium]|nr:calcium/sodium antiporter [Planctomycetota bacterium]
MTLILFGIGFGLLILGAELLVRGGSRLAIRAGVSPLVIGLTIVAYGTSTPELAVNVQASMAGRPDLALGNVVGSNILNVLLILGVAAVLAPLAISPHVLRRDLPIMIGVSVLLLPLAMDGHIGRVDGLLMTGAVVLYTLTSIRAGRRQHLEAQGTHGGQGPVAFSLPSIWGHVLSVLCGLVLLVVGTRWIVDGAVFIAQSLGLSELVIGLTVVAAGTSLPELTTSALATARGERDIAIGNIVGSNIYNILAILGISSLIHPIPVTQSVLWFDLPVMIATALVCLPLFLTGRALSRGEGLLFLGYYVAYTVYLILDGLNHERLPAYRQVMLFAVLPLTLITIGLLAARKRGIRR